MKSLKEPMQSFAETNREKLENVINEALVSGYKHGAKEMYECLWKNPPQGKEMWQKLNFGAITEKDMVCGITSKGKDMTFEEASSLNVVKLPSKEDLLLLYQTCKHICSYNQGSNWPYNQRAVFSDGSDINIIFYGTCNYSIDIPNRENPFNCICHIWLSDPCEDSNNALSAIIPMQYDFQRCYGEYTGIVFDPIFVEVPKSTRLKAHFMINKSIMED